MTSSGVGRDSFLLGALALAALVVVAIWCGVWGVLEAIDALAQLNGQ